MHSVWICDPFRCAFYLDMYPFSNIYPLWICILFEHVSFLNMHSVGICDPFKCAFYRNKYPFGSVFHLNMWPLWIDVLLNIYRGNTPTSQRSHKTFTYFLYHRGSQYRVPCCRSCAHPCTPQFQPKQPIHSLSPPSMLCQWLSLRLPPFPLSWWLHKNLNLPPRFWARKWSTNGEYVWVQGRRSGGFLEDAWWRGMREAKGALLGLRVCNM